MSAEALLDILEARHGIVCAVGAAGKKSTLYRLLAAHPGHVAFTSTVFTYPFPDDFPAHVVLAPPAQVVEAALAAACVHRKIAYASPADKPGRLHGVPAADVVRCHAQGGFDATFVKADGARMRLLKAPAEHEPQLWPGVDTVIGVLSARVVGMPLTERHVHRPELVARIAGLAVGEELAPIHLARIMASPEGLLRHVDRAARFVPVINMADAPQHRAHAIEAAQLALDLSDRFDRVLVAAMREADPVVAVVTRPGGA